MGLAKRVSTFFTPPNLYVSPCRRTASRANVSVKGSDKKQQRKIKKPLTIFVIIFYTFYCLRLPININY